ncbi:MAG TPA: sulfate ABC transporter substrate-binding protein [Solirubrobacteraceae bacterium]|nr:sulfate ABC transporter substrate-binding protein [Solirubrobacteraceae bacterium]
MRPDLTTTGKRAGAFKGRRASALAAAAATVAAVAVAGCGGSSDTTSSANATTPAASKGGTQLSLVAYSTPSSAYAKLIAAYEQTPAGKGVSFTTSFGPSGTQSRAVAAGQPADVVNFSLTADVTRLVKAGLVAANWDAGPTRGIVTDSVVAFGVRPGNPKHITSWADLTKPGVKVITPNPFTSGASRWNIVAAYGAQLKLGKTPAQAQAYLQALLKNVVTQPSAASAALQTFASGEGDVVLDYEDDLIHAKKKGIGLDYVVPAQTVLIENPIAVTVKSAHAGQAQAFVNWLESPTGQALWAKEGYRPVLPSVAAQFKSTFAQPAKLFTIAYLGGWTAVTTKFFDPTAGIVTKLEQQQGVSTATG